jgi:hypothetical protein
MPIEPVTILLNQPVESLDRIAPQLSNQFCRFLLHLSEFTYIDAYLCERLNLRVTKIAKIG